MKNGHNVNDACNIAISLYLQMAATALTTLSVYTCYISMFNSYMDVCSILVLFSVNIKQK